jgi:hypothetical protein
MTTNRRDFLKFVVAGSVAAGCPVDMTLLAAPAPSPTSAPPIVDGEHNEICHQVRDGHVFAKPPVSARYDVVIVGGGMSGLAAAYHLKAYNYLLLEKEEHWGGNAYEEVYNGQYFATGSAFDTEGSEADQLAQALGLKQLPIDSPDPTIVRGKLVANTWLSGLDDLPLRRQRSRELQEVSQRRPENEGGREPGSVGRPTLLPIPHRLRSGTETVVGLLRTRRTGAPSPTRPPHSWDSTSCK